MHSQTTIVNLYLQDVNDNAPIFEESLYSGNVKETDVYGTSITVVSATDKDPTFFNSDISYRVVGEGVDKFEVHEKNGKVQIAQSANLDLVLNNGVKNYRFVF